MELIDKKSALEKIYLAGESIKEYSGRFYEGKFNGYQCAYEIINDMPTEERPQGYWKEVGSWHECSCCNQCIDSWDKGWMKYCPNCGAIMENNGDDDDE